jgi:hypothetical protein
MVVNKCVNNVVWSYRIAIISPAHLDGSREKEQERIQCRPLCHKEKQPNQRVKLHYIETRASSRLINFFGPLFLLICFIIGVFIFLQIYLK